MKDGFIKVAAATPHLFLADPEKNAVAVCQMIEEADRLGAKLICFPELCLTGYTCGDLFFQTSLLDVSLLALKQVQKASCGRKIAVIASAPLCKDNKLYNCAIVLFDGKILGVIPKRFLPNYGEFYERRQFTPAPAYNTTITLAGQAVPFGTGLIFQCEELAEFCFGVEICEDLWVAQPPSGKLALAGATIIANPSASDETIGKAAYRRNLVCGQSARLLSGYIYADAGDGESSGDMVFACHNLIAENGSLLAESKLFEHGLTVSEIDVSRLAHERRRTTTFEPEETESFERIYFSCPLSRTNLSRTFAVHPFVPSNLSERQERCEEILSIQSHGLARRMAHAHSDSLVIGISGGLDSCLALLVAARATDLLNRARTDIIAVTMPCFGTTHRTKSNAEILCNELGVSFREVPITESVRCHFKDIGHDESTHNVVYENAQARERTQVLMDIANAKNGLVVGTGDLSELALGWATYNGDHMSMYGVNASVPKTLVRHIVQYVSDCSAPALADVLRDILDTPVSPELLPAEADGTIAQRTEDLVGPYDLHDFYLYYLMRFGFSPKKIYRLALLAFDKTFSPEEILKWLKIFCRRFFNQQFKRSCLPDGPKVGSVTLSPRGDWRMPSDAFSSAWLNQLESL